MTNAEPRLARVAAAIADPTRARTLARLLDGRLHTAGELAAHAGVGAATMSAHLKLLVDEGLARVRPQGRHRYFGLADGDVAHALEALLRVADGRNAEPAADVRRWQKPAMRGLRHARTCYGHLAGELGVRWREVLLAKGWVTAAPDGRYELSESGREALTGLMPVGFTAAGRVLYDCVDWSERRDHFAGPLAVAWLEAMEGKGWLRRVAGSRELGLTPPGRTALVEGLLTPLPTARNHVRPVKPPARPTASLPNPEELALAGLPNLGPKSAQALVAAGISSFADVQRLGSVATYAKVKRADARVSLNLLWALEGALSGLPWQVVARQHRTSLLLALDALCGGP